MNRRSEFDESIHSGEWTPEAIAAFWDYASQHSPQGGYFSEVLAQGLIQVAEWTGHLTSGDRVVDFGCGRGPLIDALLKHGPFEVGGVEFSEESASTTNDRFAEVQGYLGTQVAGDAQLFGGTPFDLAYCIEVIEHLTDEFLEPSLGTLAQLVRPGGALVVTTPFDEKLDEHQAFCPFCRTQFHHMQHVRSWDVESLSAGLKSAGFRIVFCKPVNLQRFCYGQPKGRRDKLAAACRSVVRTGLSFVSQQAAFRYASKPGGENLLAIAIRS